MFRFQKYSYKEKSIVNSSLQDPITSITNSNSSYRTTLVSNLLVAKDIEVTVFRVAKNRYAKNSKILLENGVKNRNLIQKALKTDYDLHSKSEQTVETSKIFYNYTFDKGRLKSLVSWSLKNYGEYKTINLLENLKKIGFEYATKAGISLGIEDLKIPAKKALLLYEAEEITKKAIDQYNRSEITGVERFQRLIDTWHRTSEQLKQEVIDNFENTDILNPVYMMAFSGARGNISQVRQLVGMRGLMADPKGQIIDYPIRSNFREGLTLTEYIISCYGARKGIVDTALRTANAGYLTRRLVDVAQHVVISNYDCGTKKGIFLTDMKEGNKTIYSLQTRLVGRVLARDVYQFTKTNKGMRFAPQIVSSKLASRNEEISADLAFKLSKKAGPKIFVRSPLTCETKKLICQLCYGWSLAQGNLVSIGEAVGIVAAQSIGEPGTQLTMRTFHTGGVFSGDISDQIRAPYKGFVHYFDQIAGTLIRTPEGKMAFLTKVDGSLCVYNQNTNISQAKVFKIPAYTILYYKNGEPVIEKQVIAQISTIARQQNMRDDSELIVKSLIQGQFFVKTLQVQENFIGPKPKKQNQNKNKLKQANNSNLELELETTNNPLVMTQVKTSWDWGYAWILSCKLYKIPIFSQSVRNEFNLIPRFGDFVDRNSIMSKINWILPPHGGHFTYVDTNLQNANPSFSPNSNTNSYKNTNGFTHSLRSTSTKSYSKTSNYIFKNLNIKKNLLKLDINKIYFNKTGYFIENANFIIFLPNNIKGLNNNNKMSTQNYWKTYTQKLQANNVINNNQELNTFNLFKPLTELSNFFGLQVFPKHAFLKGTGLLTSENLFASACKGLEFTTTYDLRSKSYSALNKSTTSGRLFLVQNLKKTHSFGSSSSGNSNTSKLKTKKSLQFARSKQINHMLSYSGSTKKYLILFNKNRNLVNNTNNSFGFAEQLSNLAYNVNTYTFFGKNKNLEFLQKANQNSSLFAPQIGKFNYGSKNSKSTKNVNYNILNLWKNKVKIDKLFGESLLVGKPVKNFSVFNSIFSVNSNANSNLILDADHVNLSSSAQPWQDNNLKTKIIAKKGKELKHIKAYSKKDILTQTICSANNSNNSLLRNKLRNIGFNIILRSKPNNIKISRVNLASGMNIRLAEQIETFDTLLQNRYLFVETGQEPYLFASKKDSLLRFARSKEIVSVETLTMGSNSNFVPDDLQVNPQILLFAGDTQIENKKKIYNLTLKTLQFLNSLNPIRNNMVYKNSINITYDLLRKSTSRDKNTAVPVFNFNRKHGVGVNQPTVFINKTYSFNSKTKTLTLLGSDNLGLNKSFNSLNNIVNLQFTPKILRFSGFGFAKQIHTKIENEFKDFYPSNVLKISKNKNFIYLRFAPQIESLLNIGQKVIIWNKGSICRANAPRNVLKTTQNLKQIENKTTSQSPAQMVYKTFNFSLLNVKQSIHGANSNPVQKNYNLKGFSLDKYFSQAGVPIFINNKFEVTRKNPLIPCIFDKQMSYSKAQPILTKVSYLSFENSSTSENVPGLKEWLEYSIFRANRKLNKKQFKDAEQQPNPLPKIKWYINPQPNKAPRFLPAEFIKIEKGQNKIVDCLSLANNQVCYFSVQPVKRLNYNLNAISKNIVTNSGFKNSLKPLAKSNVIGLRFACGFAKQIQTTQIDSSVLNLTNSKTRYFDCLGFLKLGVNNKSNSICVSNTNSNLQFARSKQIAEQNRYLRNKNSNIYSFKNSLKPKSLKHLKPSSYKVNNKIRSISVLYKSHNSNLKNSFIYDSNYQNFKILRFAEQIDGWNKQSRLAGNTQIETTPFLAMLKNVNPIFNKQLTNFAVSPLSKTPNAALEKLPYIVKTTSYAEQNRFAWNTQMLRVSNFTNSKKMNTNLIDNRSAVFNAKNRKYSTNQSLATAPRLAGNTQMLRVSNTNLNLVTLQNPNIMTICEAYKMHNSKKINLHSFVLTYNVPTSVFDYQFKKLDVCLNHMVNTNILLSSLTKTKFSSSLLTQVLSNYSDLNLLFKNRYVRSSKVLDLQKENTNLTGFMFKKAILGLFNIVCFELNLIFKFKNYKYGLKSNKNIKLQNKNSNFGFATKIHTQIANCKVQNQGIIDSKQLKELNQLYYYSNIDTVLFKPHILQKYHFEGESNSTANYKQRIQLGPTSSYFKTHFKVYFDNVNYALNSLSNTSFLSSYSGEIIKQPISSYRISGTPRIEGIEKHNLSKVLNYPYIQKQEIKNNKQRCLLLTKKDLVSYKFSLNSRFAEQGDIQSFPANHANSKINNNKQYINPLQLQQLWSKNKKHAKQALATNHGLQLKLLSLDINNTQELGYNLCPKTTLKNISNLIKKSSIYFDTISTGKIGSFILRGEVAQKEFNYTFSKLLKSNLNNNIKKSLPKVYSLSGQIIHLNTEKITIRKAQPIFISAKSTFHAFHGDFVQSKEQVITLIYQKLKTGDIIQGIPKVEQFFEARTTKRGRLFRDNLPNLLKGLFIKYYVYSLKLLRHGFTDINPVLFAEQTVKRGAGKNGKLKTQQASDLSSNPTKNNNTYQNIAEQSLSISGSHANRNLAKNLANLDYTYVALQWAVKQSFYKIQQIAVDGVLRVYRSQGVTISDKHLEIIVKQMTTKVRVIQGGQTGFFPGEIVDLDFVETINSAITSNMSGPTKIPLTIYYEPMILGITKASLQVDSFLSSASFQQTARILSQSALFNKKDFLKGVKENVILGNLIPAGTGYLVSFFD